MRRGFRGLGAIGIAVAALAATATPANAVTIGQLAPGSAPTASAINSPFDYLQPTVTSGAGYVVPAGASKITSWSTNAAAGIGQQLKFKVFRHVSGSQWMVVASDLETLTPSIVNTFTVNIAVKAGDVIGLNDGNASNSTPNAAFFGSTVTGMLIGNGDLADGATSTFFPTDGQLNVSAHVTGPSTGPPPPPVSTIHAHPKAKVTTHKKKAKVRFSFSSNEAGSTFMCKLDKGVFSRCASPKTYQVKPGKHEFSVKATNASGRTGAPVSFRFKVVRK